jgi:hypothetical protein
LTAVERQGVHDAATYLITNGAHAILAPRALTINGEYANPVTNAA